MAKAKGLKITVKDLKELTKKGNIKARKQNRCRILLLASEGKSQYEIAGILSMSRTAVNKICQRYERGGLENALNERARPGAPSIFSGK